MMKILRLSLLSVVAALGSASPGPAQAEVTNWKQVGDWSIDFYPGFPGCAASIAYESGTFFLIGFKKRDDGIDLQIGMIDDAWKSIEEGKEYSVKVYFGNETPWTLDMYGAVFEDSSGLSFSFDAAKEQAGYFVDEFKRETSMKWFYQDVMIGHYSLSGTRRAFDETVACQRSFNDAIAGVSDPFSGTRGGAGSDPFSR